MGYIEGEEGRAHQGSYVLQPAHAVRLTDLEQEADEALVVVGITLLELVEEPLL